MTIPTNDPVERVDDSTGLIYHYTNARALKSIVSLSELWASETSFLNDEHELALGSGLVYELLQAELDALQATLPDFSKQTPTNAELILSARLGAMRYALQPPNRYVEHSHLGNRVFVSCFCGKGDLLSQWRSYGHSGYSIGFDKTELGKANTGFVLSEEQRSITYRNIVTMPSIGVEKVRYITDIADVDAATRAEMVEAIAPLDTSPGGRGFPSLLAAQGALYQAARFKNAAFDEEDESRLIYVLPGFENDPPEGSRHVKNSEVRPEVFFRETDTSFVPYVKLNFPPAAIKQIRVGPSPEKQQRVMALRRLLNELDRDDIEVVASPTPYRG